MDGRLEAHLDGLRTGGKKGWETSLAALEAPGPGEVFVAALLACESLDGGNITDVVRLSLEDAAWQRALTSALGWLPLTRAVPVLEALLEEGAPEIRRLGIAGAAAQRWDPGPSLLLSQTAADSALRACALEAAGLLGRTDAIPQVQRALSDDDEACRFAAAWTLVRLGQRTGPAISLLKELGDSPGPYARPALGMALRCMSLGPARQWYSRLREAPEKQHLAIAAAGVLGDVELINDLLSWMAHPGLARRAGEAFSFITGADLSWEDLEGEAPEEAEIADEVEAAQTDSLPWPAADKVAAWWQQHRSDFQRGTRYLAGKPLSESGILEVLRQGTQRQRAVAALELGLRKPQLPLFEVRGAGHLQTRRLASWTS